MNKYLEPKINEFFDQLEAAMQHEKYERADIVLAQLSKYFHLFDDELTDYYQYAQSVTDIMLGRAEEHFYEPSETDEWMDFDPDC